MNRFSVTSMSLLMFLVLALSAQPAVADTLTFTGVGGNNSGGVYTYPYNFTVNGTQSVPLMCDSFQNEIYQDETWAANVHPITSAGAPGVGLFGSTVLLFNSSGSTYTAQAAYDAAGLLYLGALGKGPTNLNYLGTSTNLANGLANWAVWNLFEPTTPNPYGSGQPSSSTLNSLEQLALADVSVDMGYLSGVYVYTPVNGSQSQGGLPQEFIGSDPVPEPGITALLGFGLASLWGLRRRIAL